MKTAYQPRWRCAAKGVKYNYDDRLGNIVMYGMNAKGNVSKPVLWHNANLGSFIPNLPQPEVIPEPEVLPYSYITTDVPLEDTYLVKPDAEKQAEIEAIAQGYREIAKEISTDLPSESQAIAQLKANQAAQAISNYANLLTQKGATIGELNAAKYEAEKATAEAEKLGLLPVTATKEQQNMTMIYLVGAIAGIGILALLFNK
jgi:hypothetical protein